MVFLNEQSSLAQKSLLRCTLTTIVDPPHRDSVVSLASGDGIVVTAAGTQFKVWVLVDNAQWDCFFVGSFQEMPCSLVTVSPDNSIVAAVFGKTVTLWSLQHRQRIAALPHDDAISTMSFVGRRGRLATASQFSLFVWDLISLQGAVHGIVFLCPLCLLLCLLSCCCCCCCEQKAMKSQLALYDNQ
jgi:hypothetical protein